MVEQLPSLSPVWVSLPAQKLSSIMETIRDPKFIFVKANNVKVMMSNSNNLELIHGDMIQKG